MIPRTPTLAEWPYGMVRLACGLCCVRVAASIARERWLAACLIFGIFEQF
jgi:hypothetical protein